MMSPFAAPAIAALLKSTLLFGAALLTLRVMRRSPAAARHAVCIVALIGALLLLPLTILPSGVAVPVAAFRITTSSSAAASGLPGTAADWTRIALFGWLAGALVLVARHIGGMLLVRRVASRATVVDDGDWRTDMADAARALGLDPRRVTLHRADVHAPVTCGVMRPVILIPMSAQDWPASQRHAVLTHELAHVQRGDLWTNLIAALATFAFWFHPLAWMLARRLREEQECACDDIVLNRGFTPTVYAEALVGAASAQPSGSLFACAMNGGAFRNRVAHVLDAARCRTIGRAAIARIALIAVAGVVLLGVLQPARAGEDVYKIGGDVQPPQLITKIEPKYTDEAKDAKLQGKVVLKVVIGSSGRVTESTVVEGLDAGLDHNAQDALAQWVFKPGTKKGEPVAVQAMIEVNFRLR